MLARGSLLLQASPHGRELLLADRERRKERHVRIDDRLDHDGAIGTKRVPATRRRRLPGRPRESPATPAARRTPRRGMTAAPARLVAGLALGPRAAPT